VPPLLAAWPHAPPTLPPPGVPVGGIDSSSATVVAMATLASLVAIGAASRAMVRSCLEHRRRREIRDKALAAVSARRRKTSQQSRYQKPPVGSSEMNSEDEAASDAADSSDDAGEDHSIIFSTAPYATLAAGHRQRADDSPTRRGARGRGNGADTHAHAYL
jgi:hypothetical protein